MDELQRKYAELQGIKMQLEQDRQNMNYADNDHIEMAVYKYENTLQRYELILQEIKEMKGENEIKKRSAEFRNLVSINSSITHNFYT